jgi:hypothetical protein
MVKSKLISFIGKYNLGGNIDSVKLVVEKDVLTTVILSPERSIHGTIRMKDFVFPDAELAVYETSRLKQILNCITEDMVIDPVIENGKTVAIKIENKDGKTKANFALSDISVIPATPPIKNIPKFNLEIPLTKEFIADFIRAKNSLGDAENFTIIQDKKGTNVVVGYSPTLNTHKISIKVIPTVGKDVLAAPISFSARYLKEILQANPEVVDSTMFVSDGGMAQVKVGTDNTDFCANYYLTKVPIV